MFGAGSLDTRQAQQVQHFVSGTTQDWNTGSLLLVQSGALAMHGAITLFFHADDQFVRVKRHPYLQYALAVGTMCVSLGRVPERSKAARVQSFSHVASSKAIITVSWTAAELLVMAEYNVLCTKR